MPTYGLPDDEVPRLLAEVMEKHHRELHLAEVRIGVLMCSELLHGGYPAYATIKVVPLKDRLTKDYDAELVLDRHLWERLRHRHRKALLDHELSHLAVAKFVEHESEDGEVSCTFATDDIGRPKLKTVKGNWNGGDGFREVVKRHGDWAIEFLNAQRCHTFAVAARDNVEPSTQKLMDTLEGFQKRHGVKVEAKLNQSTFTEPEGEPH